MISKPHISDQLTQNRSGKDSQGCEATANYLAGAAINQINVCCARRPPSIRLTLPDIGSACQGPIGPQTWLAPFLFATFFPLRGRGADRNSNSLPAPP